jgi:broad specificity phosphatase PhoE/glycosyltransferase involved in cell wall biosynthesis
VKGVPVTPQIFGFENVDSEFILQVDSDAIIVRRDRNHSYLKDMVSSLESRPNAISISFNIAHEEGSPAKEYDSPGDGGFVPEVRFCLIHRNRLMEQLPLPNSVEDGMLQMTWYRSLHRAQKERGLVSLRGGDPRSFYIHPPNERKTKIGEWKEIVSRAEAGFVPRVQYESVDLEGQIEEWKGPKRKEEYVFIICGRNAGPGKFERCWTSLLQQNFERWGAIIIDDSSDDGTGDYIRGALEGRKRNTTLIVNRERRGVLANINNAIRGYCVNPDSVIIILDMDDMLLGPNALRVIHNHFMRGADMTVGTYWRSGKGIPDFKADFHNLSPPRCGDVWMHPRAFRKYLFDAVPEDRMKHNGEWIDKFTELTYMVPIAQMSQRPRQIHVPLYFWEPHHPRNMDHYRRNQETIGYVASYEPLPKLERESLVLPAGELCNKEFHEPSVIFLRHAEKMVPQDRGSDHADVPLTEQGKEDSRVFGGQIRGKIGQIISSPTLRTMQTAESIREGNRSDCPITVLSDFRTSGCKNRSLWDIKKKELGWSRLIRSWIDGDLPLDIVESHLEFALNLLSLVSANMGKNEDAHCVVVTHDHVITALSGFFNDPAFRVGYLSGFARSKESVARLLEEDRMERNGLQS